MEYRMLPERLLTADDLFEMEDDGWRTELSGGMLVREPQPGGEHGHLVVEISSRIREHVRQHQLGVVFACSGFQLAWKPDTVRGPDVAFVSRDRMPEDGIPRRFMQLAPDLAVEIVSPSNTAREVTRKVLEYLTAGSQLVWVVDPSSRTVTVYPGREHIRILGASDELDGAPVLPGFRLTVGELFT
jgi:Uma2 family endonuclease